VRKRNPTDLNLAEAFRVPDAAQRYSLSYSVLFAAIKSGKLEASKMGEAPRSPVIVTKAAMERYVDSCRIKPQSADDPNAA